MLLHPTRGRIYALPFGHSHLAALARLRKLDPKSAEVYPRVEDLEDDRLTQYHYLSKPNAEREVEDNWRTNREITRSGRSDPASPPTSRSADC